MCLRKLRKYLGAPALNDGSRAHQTVRNANSLRCVRLWVRAGAGKDQRGIMGIGWIFFRTWQRFHKWWMHIWKLRKYLRVPTIIHGSHTHQSVRNAKSTRGYDAGKDQRGMVGIDWILFTHVSSQTFRRWYMHIWELRKYVRVPTSGSRTHQWVRNAKSTGGYDAGKDQRGITGIDWISFSRHKHFINDVCTYGSFENIYACLPLFMVAIRTNLFATPSLRVGTCW
jgi:hypothetical protein